MARHTLCSGPMRTYPKLQLYVTRDPIVVEEKFTLPCSGLGGSPQSTATKKTAWILQSQCYIRVALLNHKLKSSISNIPIVFGLPEVHLECQFHG